MRFTLPLMAFALIGLQAQAQTTPAPAAPAPAAEPPAAAAPAAPAEQSGAAAPAPAHHKKMTGKHVTKHTMQKKSSS